MSISDAGNQKENNSLKGLNFLQGLQTEFTSMAEMIAIRAQEALGERVETVIEHHRRSQFLEEICKNETQPR